MATDYINAVVQGLNAGAHLGLGLFKARAEEERFRRQEQYQRERDAVADSQWGQQYDLAVRDRDQRQEALDLSKRRQGHVEAVYRDEQAERKRQRRIQELKAAGRPLFMDEQGLTYTDNARFAERVNNTPGADALLLESAVLNGLIPASRAKNYSGLRAIPAPNNTVVFQVYGKSGEGKPIKGDAYLSRDGTSDPDDPIVTLSLDQLGYMVMGDDYIQAKQADALAAERLAAKRRDEERERDLRLLDVEATDAHLGRYEAALSAAQEQDKRLDSILSANDPFLQRNPQYLSSPIARELQTEAANRDAQVAKLSAVLDAKKAERAKWQGAMDRNLADYAAEERRLRLSAGDAGYRAQVKGEPAARAKQAKELDDFHRQWASDLANKVHISKDDKDGISKADVEAAILALPPQYVALAKTNPDVMAALNRGAQLMVRYGMNGGLEGFIRAIGGNIDVEKYAQAYKELEGVTDPALRQEMALVKAQKGAAASLRHAGMLPQ